MAGRRKDKSRPVARKLKSGAVRTLRKGRVCKQFRCTQRLSIYNSGEFCNVHRSLQIDN